MQTAQEANKQTTTNIQQFEKTHRLALKEAIDREIDKAIHAGSYNIRLSPNTMYGSDIVTQVLKDYAALGYAVTYIGGILEIDWSTE